MRWSPSFGSQISAGTRVRNSDLVALHYDVAANESRLVIANLWLRGVPSKVRAQAFREFETARRTNIAKVTKLNAERRAAVGNRRPPLACDYQEAGFVAPFCLPD